MKKGLADLELYTVWCGAAVRMFHRPSLGTASRGDWWIGGASLCLRRAIVNSEDPK